MTWSSLFWKHLIYFISNCCWITSSVFLQHKYTMHIPLPFPLVTKSSLSGLQSHREDWRVYMEHSQNFGSRPLCLSQVSGELTFIYTWLPSLTMLRFQLRQQRKMYLRDHGHYYKNLSEFTPSLPAFWCVKLWRHCLPFGIQWFHLFLFMYIKTEVVSWYLLELCL